jgi:3-hydroxyacyl-[acyl-carrier protein] dehydratase/trans-2-decenoyl-[acyl-carrier protein] isomerase
MKHSKSTFTRDDLLKCGAGELDGAKYPRMPLPNMLMLDCITKISEAGDKYGRGEVEAEFAVNPDSWFFSCQPLQR